MFDLDRKNKIIVGIKNSGNNISKQSLIELLNVLIDEKRIINDDITSMESFLGNQGHIRALKMILDIFTSRV